MKLKELLKTITHQNYMIYVQNSVTTATAEALELTTTEEIKAHFDFTVLAINEDWTIILKGE